MFISRGHVDSDGIQCRNGRFGTGIRPAGRDVEKITPGEQIATTSLMKSRALKEEIAWSRPACLRTSGSFGAIDCNTEALGV